MSAPIDPTTTAAWARLSELKATLEPDLRGGSRPTPSGPSE